MVLISYKHHPSTSRYKKLPKIKLLLLLIIIGSHALYIDSIQALDGSLWLVKDQARPMSSRLDELLDRVGPNMRASANYRDFRDMNINDTLESWRILHERALNFAQDQVNFYKPKLTLLLGQANVSWSCSKAVEQTLNSVERLDSWAVQMWSYSGSFPPGGFLDGQFSDLGQYRGCVDIKSGHHEEQHNKHLASYCVVGFRPIVPARRRFHLIFNQESQQLLTLFNSSDIMAMAASRAQYFHYLYLKTGLCVPSQCSAHDLQLVSKYVGRRLALQSAPVKCFSRFDYSAPIDRGSSDDLDDLENSRPVEVDLNGPINVKQWVSIALVGSYFSMVFLVTLWHLFDITWTELKSTRSLDDFYDDEQDGFGHDGLSNIENSGPSKQLNHQRPKIVTNGTSSLKEVVYNYFSMITNVSEFSETSMRPNEIKCLHGFRVLTMFWIICVHTLQYNDWSGFTRAFENVTNLQRLLVHPLINANYVVDNFFLMSGLLAAYTTWNSNRGTSKNFNMFRSLLARYLRLTPQVLLISLMYIVLPLLARDGGPFWYDMTHYASKYCEKNWWVNLLHAQAFYRDQEICNLVGWWVSVDMFYYLVGLVLLWLILNKQVRFALTCTGLFVGYCTVITAWRHYSGGFSPNNLGLVPQVEEVWADFVVDFFWSPYPHAFVFFLGLWLGYLMANKIGIHQVRRRAKLGWILSIVSITAINLSSRLWTVGILDLREERQLISTSYNIICVVVWACSFGWMIVACHYGCAPVLDRLMSTDLSVMLSKASFIIYLSHMLVVRIFFGTQYNLLELSIGMFSILIIGMVFLSVLFGVFLCISFEIPCLKLQRFILEQVKRKPQPDSSNNKLSMNVGLTSVASLK